MKKIELKQHIEVRRNVTVWVPDDKDELYAAELLDKAPLNLHGTSKMPGCIEVSDEGWQYICDAGIENADGVTILHGEEENVEHGKE